MHQKFCYDVTCLHNLPSYKTALSFLSKRKKFFIFLVSFKHRLVRPPSTVTKSIFGIMIKWPWFCFFIAWEQISDGNFGFSRTNHVFLRLFQTYCHRNVPDIWPQLHKNTFRYRARCRRAQVPVVRRAERIIPDHFYI